EGMTRKEVCAIVERVGGHWICMTCGICGARIDSGITFDFGDHLGFLLSVTFVPPSEPAWPLSLFRQVSSTIRGWIGRRPSSDGDDESCPPHNYRVESVALLPAYREKADRSSDPSRLAHPMAPILGPVRMTPMPGQH